MNKVFIMLLCIIGISLIYLIYKIFYAKTYTIQAEKILPKITVVLVAKNNQKLLGHSISYLLENKKDIHEILVLDLGSFDRSVEVAHDLLSKNKKAKIVSIGKKIFLENYYNIIKKHITGDTIFILELNKINETNPNIYVPDLFKPLNKINQKEISNYDIKIDGTKLLYFDQLEREKNEYILKEYIIETLSNVSMRMEIFSEVVEKNPKVIDEQIKEIISYLNETIKKTTRLSFLIGSTHFLEEKLNDNLFQIFNDFSKNYNISINYKVHGNTKILKDPVNKLILTIIQDLLYTLIEYKLTTNINVKIKYGRKQLQLLLIVIGDLKLDNLIDNNNGLSFYMFQSIQNRLGIIGGILRLRERNTGKINILIKIPFGQTIFEKKVVDLYEE